MEENDEPGACLRNLHQLVEMDLDFGIEAILPPAPTETPAATPPPQPPVPARRARPAARGTDAARCGARTQRATGPTPPPEDDRRTLEVWPEPDFGGDAAERLAAIAGQVVRCVRCDLAEHRHNAVPGEGNPKAEFMFVGEGPGAEEDDQGRPFVGAAGRLLDRMLAAMGLSRDEVFIANVIKCRPPHNRSPTNHEACVCGTWLAEQIAAISPRVICTLGAPALKALKGDPRAGITRHRGKVFHYRDIAVVPTYHPAYLLRNETAKKPAWEDLKLVLSLVDREPPPRR